MKKFLPVFFALIGAFSVRAQDLSELIENVSPAIFKITTYDASGYELAMGTGYFIGNDGTALTNYHVLQGATKAKIKTNDKTTSKNTSTENHKQNNKRQKTIRAH